MLGLLEPLSVLLLAAFVVVLEFLVAVFLAALRDEFVVLLRILLQTIEIFALFSSFFSGFHPSEKLSLLCENHFLRGDLSWCT